MRKNIPTDELRHSLYDAISYANEIVVEHSITYTEVAGMGTTIVCLLVQGDKAYYAHVGDSRLYLFEYQQLTLLTKDHSWVQEMLDKGAISAQTAKTHPQRNQISRALGSPKYDPDVDEISNLDGKVFLLCSDGLNNMLSEHEIQAVLSTAFSLEKKVELLVEMAKEVGGLDNITIQLLQIEA